MHNLSDAVFKQVKFEAFDEGVRHALETLRDVYGEGIEETDLWAEYMKEGE